MRVTNRMMAMTSLQDMNSALTRMSTYQRQLSSMKTINKPSDNPTGAGKAMLYRTTLDKIEQYQKNVTDAKSFTSLSDSALGEINNLMTRVKTLTVRGADNSLGINEKKAIAQELREIQEHILRISNSNDGSRYFFSGTNTASPAFERVLGVIQYNGNQNEITYQLDDFVSERISSIGSDIFTSDILGSTTIDAQYRVMPLSTVPGLYPPVQSGTFSINGKTITIDPAADSIVDIITKINDSDAKVNAQITSSGAIKITSLQGGTDFIVQEGNTNFLYAFGLTADIQGGQIASSATPLTLASVFNNDAYNLTSSDLQLRRLNNGAGVTVPPPANSFTITDSEGNSISVDLSGLTATSSLSDIERQINAAVNNAPAVFNVDRIYVEYRDDSIVLRPNTDQITISEGTGTTAAELGIAGLTGTRGLPVTGAGLNPQLGVPVDKNVTEIGDFFDGAGITFPMGTITISDAAVPPNSLTVDLSSLTRHSTIADVEHAINETIRLAGSDDSHPQYPTTMQYNRVEIGVDWDMLHVSVPFGQIAITDTTGISGAELGLVTGGLTTEHFSAIALDPEMESLRITLVQPDSSRLSAVVDLSGVTTVQEFLDRVNNGAVTDTGTVVQVRAFLNESGTGFSIYAVENNVKLEISTANDLTADTMHLSGSANSKDSAGIFDTLTRLADFIENDNVDAVTAGIAWVDQSQSKLVDGRTTVGARMNRVKLVEQRHLVSEQENLTLLSDNEDADMAEAAMMFAMMQQTYQAALQATAKALPMSLMNYM